MTTKHIPARDLGGKPGRRIVVKRDETGRQPVYISCPPYLLLDADAVYALADALVDIVEHREQEVTREA